MRIKKSVVFATILGLTPLLPRAQGSGSVRLNELGGGNNPITVAVPFLNFAPDSRGSAMGDLGVATSPDIYSVHWNNAKLASIPNNMGVSFSYAPWLKNLVSDMSLSYIALYKRIDRLQTLGFTFRYFNLGEIQLTDINGEARGVEDPNEGSVDATYSRRMSDRLNLGLTFRYVWSNLAANITQAPGAKTAQSLAFDVGAYYLIPLKAGSGNSDIALGAHISNVGQRVSYSDESNNDFIPANLRIGTTLTFRPDPYNSLALSVDLNKLMVPTNPIYEQDSQGALVLDSNGDAIIKEGKDPNRGFLSGTFGSFADAPAGFGEEIKEFTLSTGAEYWFRDIFAIRTGYFFEHKDKGDRKYFTLGIGFRYEIFGVDLSYLIPQERNHPLGDTLRISLLFNLEKGFKKDIPEVDPSSLPADG